MKFYSKLSSLILLSLISSVALAKLPPPSEEAKAKAEAAKVTKEWSGKQDAFLLCKAQDKTAAYYFKSRPAKAKPMAMPACVSPGPAPVASAAAPAAKPKK